MILPSQIAIKGLQINTFGVFLIISLVIAFFIVWSEGKKDGFDTEKLFDMFLISIFFSILLSRVVYASNHALSSEEFFNHIYKFWMPGYNILGALFGFLITVFIFSKMWSWSFYRLLDIFSLGSSLGLAVLVLAYVGLQSKFEYLFAFSSWVFLFALLSRFRNSKIKSGYVFSLFLPISAILKMIFFESKGDLNFLLVLATLSLVVFIFRWRLSNYEGKIIGRTIEQIKRRVIREKERFRKS